jgi:hypothetical protein
MPSQVASSAAGDPGVQLSSSTPPTQEVTPLDVQAPTPQLVGAETKSSSAVPSQSSSIPSQVASSAAGVPGAQLSSIEPFTQDVVPLAWQAPVPQLVGIEV